MEDYEKKYKDALGMAEEIIRYYKEHNRGNETSIEDLEQIFPELKNKDEEIRKWLICGMNALKEQKNETFATIPIDDAIAWLEKQGEQKSVLDFKASNWYVSKVDGKIHDMTYNPTDKVEPKFKIGDVLCDKSCTTLNKNSQPNIEILDIRDGMYICNNCSFPISQQDEYEWVAKRVELTQSVTKKSDQDAWSDEDEAMFQSCTGAILAADSCLYEDKQDMEAWLKSLKDRITWKPSKEQMDALLGIMIESGFDYIDYNTLESLYNDLKKL